MFTAFLDIIVMLLLVLTIVFCWRLNSKIIELKSGRKDLIDLVKSLDAAVIKTNANISDLKGMAQNSAIELTDLVAKSQDNINDLSFMNDTAAKLADRLERDIAESRYISDKLKEGFSGYADDSQRDDDKPLSRQHGLKPGFNKAREELLNALKVMK